jgi:hypothetical protein
MTELMTARESAHWDQESVLLLIPLHIVWVKWQNGTCVGGGLAKKEWGGGYRWQFG